MYDSVGNPDCFVSESGDWFQSWETGKISQEPNFELIDNGPFDFDNIIIPAIETKQESIAQEETNTSSSIDS